METGNRYEYQTIQNEMTKLKDCVTTYMGFVLGGAGVAIFGIERLGSFSSIYCSLIFSLILSLVLVLLSYKFNSHNRYAGYIKLLNHERHNKKLETDENFSSWELCLGQLRRSDIKPNEYISMLDKIKLKISKNGLNDLRWVIENYTGVTSNIDRKKFVGGLYHLALAFRGKVKTSSWAFPSYIFAVFAMIIFAFIFVGLYNLFLYIIFDFNEKIYVQRELVTVIIFSVSVVIMQIYLWISFCGKLYTLMEGSATVDGYFWRFIPVRSSYLNEYNITPSYVLSEKMLTEIRSDAQIKNTSKIK